MRFLENRLVEHMLILLTARPNPLDWRQRTFAATVGMSAERQKRT